ncbi:hypothetical protein JZ751_021134 [Albula glossodonta]|uniref:Ubiquitin carboxyl-terminal hydrolase 2 n=1 Tax=Albula glossodonta TaxID=121402 RepID=A0A8T2PKJ3_9TELE|nr:hypothetical protein JZ751_021134 [Albula glossodonta]
MPQDLWAITSRMPRSFFGSCSMDYTMKLTVSRSVPEDTWKILITYHLFVGQLKSSLTCSDCGYCSTVFDPFWDLSLPISKKSYGEVSLMDCVRLFTKEDVLDGDEKPRFSEARIRMSKLSTFVNFPMKDLDLREFASENSTNAVYNLYAVSNHSGTTMGGHYTAYCRNPTTGEWYTFNDSSIVPKTRWKRFSLPTRPPPFISNENWRNAGTGHKIYCIMVFYKPVSPMSSSQVRSSDAYVLFYELSRM